MHASESLEFRSHGEPGKEGETGHTKKSESQRSTRILGVERNAVLSGGWDGR